MITISIENAAKELAKELKIRWNIVITVRHMPALNLILQLGYYDVNGTNSVKNTRNACGRTAGR